MYVTFNGRPIAEVETDKELEELQGMFTDPMVEVVEEVNSPVRGGAPKPVMDKIEELG